MKKYFIFIFLFTTNFAFSQVYKGILTNKPAWGYRPDTVMAYIIYNANGNAGIVAKNKNRPIYIFVDTNSNLIFKNFKSIKFNKDNIKTNTNDTNCLIISNETESNLSNKYQISPPVYFLGNFNYSGTNYKAGFKLYVDYDSTALSGDLYQRLQFKFIPVVNNTEYKSKQVSLNANGSIGLSNNANYSRTIMLMNNSYIGNNDTWLSFYNNHVNFRDRIALESPGNSTNYSIEINGNSDRTIGLERTNISGIEGKKLIIVAGGCKQNETNLNGGDLILSSGTATGTGSSKIQLHVAKAGSSGTTDRTPANTYSVDYNAIYPAINLSNDLGKYNLCFDSVFAKNFKSCSGSITFNSESDFYQYTAFHDDVTIDSSLSALLVKADYLQINNDSGKTCDETSRGTLKFVEGRAGVSDLLYICTKNDSDTYEWKQINYH